MTSHDEAARPWYREPWPWVLIAIPVLTIIASAITLWLAVSRPDPLVLEGDDYRQLEAGMRAQAMENPADDPDDG